MQLSRSIWLVFVRESDRESTQTHCQKLDHETPLLLGKDEYQTLKAERKAQRQEIKLKILGMFR